MLFKIVVIGDVGVGKTAFIKKHVHGVFSNEYKSTIGVDFALKKYTINDILCNVQLWDIAGQERFGNMTRVYYREAHASIIVFDLSNKKTFYDVLKWKEDIDAKLDPKLPCLLLGNKSDLDCIVTENDIKDLLKKPRYKHVIYSPISVKCSENEYINSVMINFISKILEENKHLNTFLESPREDIVKLSEEKYIDVDINSQKCCITN